MKDNPLAKAIESRAKFSKREEPKRTLSVFSADVPREVNVGDSVTFIVTGTLQSLSNGSAVVSVDEIEQEEPDDQEMESPKVQRVMTQESNYGGA